MESSLLVLCVAAMTILIAENPEFEPVVDNSVADLADPVFAGDTFNFYILRG